MFLLLAKREQYLRVVFMTLGEGYRDYSSKVREFNKNEIKSGFTDQTLDQTLICGQCR
jgi:hypothetical protein